MSQFTKADQGKEQIHLIDPSFILGVAKVLAHGAEKYGANNWRKCEDPTRYFDAAMRHLLAIAAGEELDSDSGLPHIHHVACNVMFMSCLK